MVLGLARGILRERVWRISEDCVWFNVFVHDTHNVRTLFVPSCGRDVLLSELEYANNDRECLITVLDASNHFCVHTYVVFELLDYPLRGPQVVKGDWRGNSIQWG